MVGSVSQKELLSSGCIAADVEKDATDAIGGLDHGLVDGAGLDGMLVGHLEGIIGQLVETIGPDLFIADIYFCVKAGKVNIDPVGVFRDGVEKAGIADNGCIDWVFEAKRIAGAVEGLVLVRREIDPEITASLRRVGAVAGYKTGKYQQNPGRYGHSVIFKFLRV